jgi:hypothetical protein
MITYVVGDGEVSAYLRDFLVRLEQFDPIPTLWCPVTRSGNLLLSRLLDLVKEHHPKLAAVVSVLSIQANGGSRSDIRFLGGDARKDVQGKTILLFDSAIHSGKTIATCMKTLFQLGAQPPPSGGGVNNGAAPCDPFNFAAFVIQNAGRRP